MSPQTSELKKAKCLTALSLNLSVQDLNHNQKVLLKTFLWMVIQDFIHSLKSEKLAESIKGKQVLFVFCL